MSAAPLVIDRVEVERALRLLHSPGDVFEVRVPDARLVTYNGRPDPRTATAFGYFDSAESALDALPAFQGAEFAAIYTTLNPVNPALLSRGKNRFQAAGRKSATTSDHDIPRRRNLLIDADAKRPAGVSTTPEEHDAALERVREIAWLLSELGWPDPIVADSGNGAHLDYALDLPADDGGHVTGLLKALGAAFDDEKVQIDQTVFNPARITKLYGTIVRKGDDTPERPHRMSKILSAPAEREIVSRETIRETTETLIAGLEKETEPPKKAAPPTSSTPKTTGAFNVRDFMARHFPDAEAKDWHGGTCWILDPCPFNSDHKGTSAATFQTSGGALAFKCQHNGCAGLQWRDLRERFEPKATRPTPAPRVGVEPEGPAAEKAEPKDTGETMPEPRVVLLDLPDVIRNVKRRNPISTGLPHLDALLGGGLSAGESFVTGGGPGSIKTTGMATIIEAMAGPKTAGYCIFFDENYERVCRKVATRFGLRYDETEEPAESILDQLQGELERRAAILKIIWPRTGPSVEEIVDACLAATPAGRVPVFYLDHLHKMHTDTANLRDQTPAAMTKVVDACLKVTDAGGILYAISEVTKAALTPEAVRLNPASVFADTRAILSRFDVGFATVKLPTAAGSREVLAEVIATGKNRMGDGSVGFVNVLNLDTWGVTTRALEGVTAEADELKAAAKGKARKEQMDADDDLVLTFIAGHAVSQEIGCRKTSIETDLPAGLGPGVISRDRIRFALVRLRTAKRIGEHQWKTPGKTGPAADYVRIRHEEETE